MGWLRQLVKRKLLERGIIVTRPPGQFDATVFKLHHAACRGLRPNLIVDGGAAEGEWAADAHEIWPDAQILCIEPRDEAQIKLHALAGKTPGIHVAHTLIGAIEGTTDFYQHGHQSSILKDSEGQEWGKRISAPITTLDALVTKMKLPDPDMIKLDLQGAELDALRGAPRCLAHAESVVLEVSFIELQKGMPLIADVIAFMVQHDFRAYDVLSLWHRPKDGVMAQGDFLFVKNSSSLWAETSWD